jgi:excisionase family DNA binding protein
MSQEYYSVTEFSVLMGVHPLTIRSAIRKGRIIAVRVGSGKKSPYRIPHSEIERLTLLSYHELKGDIK